LCVAFDSTKKETIVIHPLLTIRKARTYAIVGSLLLGAGWSAVAQQPTPNLPPPVPSPQPSEQTQAQAREAELRAAQAREAQVRAAQAREAELRAAQAREAQVREAVVIQRLQAANQRLHFTIDPKTPLKDLLPTPPAAKAQKPSAFVDALADVPELMLSEPIAKGTPNQKAMEAIALQIAKTNHLNKEKSDRFMEALLAERADLAGLPFQMGGDCRLSTTRSRYFKDAVTMVRNSLGGDERQTGVLELMAEPAPSVPGGGGPGTVPPPAAPQPVPVIADPPQVRQVVTDLDSTFMAIANSAQNENGSAFLVRFQKNCLAVDDAVAASRMKEHKDHAASARLAAMTQICAPTSDSMKLAMARYLASVSSVDSTHALVKTILFTPEEDARNTAIEALKARRDKDYVDPLLQGFRYPWPDVAKRAADALVKLDRKDVVSQIIDVLDEPDPRAPVTKKVDGKTVTTVREIVRINHHRNCLMCHSPGQEVHGDSDILTAQTPIPGQPLPSLSGGYGNQSIPELVVRIDVTYLRQDFSAMLPVADAAPWPQMQRFDFVVRTRTLKDDEVKAYKEKFDNLEPGVLPPNHRAALTALRKLTGKDTAPTADAWRQLVKAK
jgi:hypothetical protein